MDSSLILDYKGGQISAALEKGTRVLTDGIAFRLHAGETMAMIGETGSGKTITALSVMRLLPPGVESRGGKILFRGEPLPPARKMRSLLGKSIVYIPQNGMEALSPSRTVRRHLYDTLRRLGVPAAERAGKAEEVLRRVGFSEPEAVLKRYPFELSGGMAQRVTIALAACAPASLVIADEPTNGLDRKATAGFMALLAELFPQAARLVITHDMEVAALCEKMLVLCGGKMMESGPAAALLADPAHPYTKALQAALVASGMKETPLLREGGSPCPFYKRCPEASDACRTAVPVRQEQGGKVWWCRDDR